MPDLVAGLFEHDADGGVRHLLGIAQWNFVFEFVAGQQFAADLDGQLGALAVHDPHPHRAVVAGCDIGLQEIGG